MYWLKTREPPWTKSRNHSCLCELILQASELILPWIFIFKGVWEGSTICTLWYLIQWWIFWNVSWKGVVGDKNYFASFANKNITGHFRHMTFTTMTGNPDAVGRKTIFSNQLKFCKQEQDILVTWLLLSPWEVILRFTILSLSASIMRIAQQIITTYFDIQTFLTMNDSCNDFNYYLFKHLLSEFGNDDVDCFQR